MDDYTTQSNLLQIHYNYFAYGYPFKCQLHKMVKDTTNCFSVFNHFVGLAIKGLIKSNNGINQFRCIQGNFLNLKDRLGWKHQKSLSKEQNTGKKTKFQKNPGNVTENEQQWKKFGFAHSKNAFHTKKTTISYQILNPPLGCTFSFLHLGFHSLDVWFIFQMEFTPYKNEQSLHGMELQENKTAKVKGI